MKHLLFISLFLLIFTSSFGQQENPLKGKYLLVIDIQDCFLNKVDDSTRTNLIAEVNAAIKQADPEKVIYIQSILRTLSITKKGFQVDTVANLDFAKELSMVNQTIFTKIKPNSFSNAEFANYLKEHQAKEIVLAGLMAEHCVSATALGGLAEGYQVLLLPNAIIGKTEADKAKALKKMKKKGVKDFPVAP